MKRNIAQFGGDVDNITIAGESSGANSVFSHIVSPYSTGKFQYAIAMSGGNVINAYPNIGSPLPLSDALKQGEGFAKAANCDSADCLRQLSVADILKYQTPFMARRPIIDGDFLPMTYADAFKQGKFNKVTLINGGNKDEGRFFTGTIEQATGKPMTDESYRQIIKRAQGQLADKVLAQYPTDNYLNAGETYAATYTDSVFACSGQEVSRILSPQIPVYAYEFADETAPSYLGETSVATKAAHTYEIPYLFAGFKGSSDKSTALNGLQEKLSDQMIAIWTNVKNLKQLEPDWQPYNPTEQNVMVFKLPTSQIAKGKYSRQHQCEFWEKNGLY